MIGIGKVIEEITDISEETEIIEILKENGAEVEGPVEITEMIEIPEITETIGLTEMTEIVEITEMIGITETSEITEMADIVEITGIGERVTEIEVDIAMSDTRTETVRDTEMRTEIQVVGTEEVEMEGSKMSTEVFLFT